MGEGVLEEDLCLFPRVLLPGVEALEVLAGVTGFGDLAGLFAGEVLAAFEALLVAEALAGGVFAGDFAGVCLAGVVLAGVILAGEAAALAGVFPLGLFAGVFFPTTGLFATALGSSWLASVLAGVFLPLGLDIFTSLETWLFKCDPQHCSFFGTVSNLCGHWCPERDRFEGEGDWVGPGFKGRCYVHSIS